MAFATTTTEDGLSISTDKDDYAPGDTVRITGAGWERGDSVDFVITEDPATHEPHTWTLGVDDVGGFVDEHFEVKDHDLGVTFTLTATSRATGRSLTVTFTDGNLQLQPNPSPDPFSPNADGIKETSTISWRITGSGNENGVALRIRQGTAIGGTTVRDFSIGNKSPGDNGTVIWDGKNNAVTPVVVSEGEYTIRIFSSTQTEASATSGQRIYISLVDNTAPVISIPTVSPTSVTQGVSTPVTVTGRATDNPAAGVAINRYQPTSAQYRIGAGGFATMTLANLSPSVANARNLSATITGGTVQGLPAGDHLVCMRATDDAGNTSGIAITGNPNCATLHVISPDNQPPTLTCTVLDPTLWYASNVTVFCTASDAASGLANASDASFSLSTNVPANAETSPAGTGTRQVCDNLNNCATAGPYLFKVDRKAPVVSCGLADANWHAADVSIACTATDGGSGLANVLDASFSLTTSVSAGTETINALTDSKNVLDAVGNSATAGPVGNNKVDKKAPTVACGAADVNWHDSDVSIHCTASDAGAGLANAADASFDLTTNVAANTETANAETDSRDVIDDVGNSSTAGPIAGNKIDKKAPAVSCGAADVNWHAADVSIGCTASDGGSGLEDPSDASFDLTTNVPDGTETANASTNARTIKDALGHSTPAGPIAGNKVDKKDPTVACGAADGNWHAADVSIGCTASDGGSGLEDPSDASFDLTTNVSSGTETANASTNARTIKDAVGHSTPAGPIGGNKVDKKDPAIACGTADGVWHASDVSIDCTASDGGSGLAVAADASFSLSTSVPIGTETANAMTGTRNVADLVSNAATAGPIGGNQVDKKGPVVALTCPASSLLLNAPTNANWTATDGGSLVASGYASGSIVVPTGSVGPKTVTVSAGTSHDNVGNLSTPSNTCGYSVAFVFAGFRTPVDNNGLLNGANSGQAIPLKWELRDYAGAPVTNLASVNVTAVSLTCAAGVTADLIEEYAAGASGLINNGGGSYQFNWKTPTSYARSCKTMKLDLGEGTPRIALFEFRK